MSKKDDLNEYTNYVIKDMIDMYGISEIEASRLIQKYNFDKMIQKAPEFVLHYNTEVWAEKIYKGNALQTI